MVPIESARIGLTVPAIVSTVTTEAAAPAPPPASEADAKRLKQVEAMKTVLGKSPHKALGKLLEGEEDINILTGLIAIDDKKLAKLAELMIDDKDKAQKLAAALVNKAKKDATAEGGGPV